MVRYPHKLDHEGLLVRWGFRTSYRLLNDTASVRVHPDGRFPAS
jgi:hypothetical protein